MSRRRWSRAYEQLLQDFGDRLSTVVNVGQVECSCRKSFFGSGEEFEHRGRGPNFQDFDFPKGSRGGCCRRSLRLRYRGNEKYGADDRATA